MAAQKIPTEAQCREMIDSMLGMMKTSPPPGDRDWASAQMLIAQVEAMVRDNRQRGVSECDTWAAFSKMLVNQ